MRVVEILPTGETSLEWRVRKPATFIFCLVFFTSTVIVNAKTVVRSKAALHYGPSIATLTAVDVIDKNKDGRFKVDESGVAFVDLSDHRNHAVVLPLLHNKVLGYAEDVFEERGNIKSNHFYVLAPRELKIMAVVQEMDLIPEAVFSHSHHHGICDNFIMFSEEGDGVVNASESIACGSFNSWNKPPLINRPFQGIKYFKSSGNSINVTFNFGTVEDNGVYQVHKQSELDLSGVGTRKLYRLSIAFTAYEECLNEDFSRDKSTRSLVPCGAEYVNFQLTSKTPCIDVSLMCDGVANCAENPDVIGVDEKICTKPPFPHTTTGKQDNRPVFSSSHENNFLEFRWNAIVVIIFAVLVAMILASVTKFCCTTCVGKHSSGNNNDTSEETPTGEENLGYSHSPSRTSSVVLANLQTWRHSMQFDSPPSYEDLFPSQKEIELKAAEESQTKDSTSSSVDAPKTVSENNEA